MKAQPSRKILTVEIDVTDLSKKPIHVLADWEDLLSTMSFKDLDFQARKLETRKLPESFDGDMESIGAFLRSDS